MSDTDDAEHTQHRESDGRSIKIETSHYAVQVWGDPDDSFDNVMDKTAEAADKAKKDIRDMEKGGEKGGIQ